MKKDKEKKLTYFLRAAMMVLTTILIVLFLIPYFSATYSKYVVQATASAKYMYFIQFL